MWAHRQGGRGGRCCIRRGFPGCRECKIRELETDCFRLPEGAYQGFLVDVPGFRQGNDGHNKGDGPQEKWGSDSVSTCEMGSCGRSGWVWTALKMPTKRGRSGGVVGWTGVFEPPLESHGDPMPVHQCVYAKRALRLGGIPSWRPWLLAIWLFPMPVGLLVARSKCADDPAKTGRSVVPPGVDSIPHHIDVKRHQILEAGHQQTGPRG